VDVTIYRDPAAYTSHPCLVRLTNGDLLVAFNKTLPRHPPLHPPDDPRSLTLIARSVDGGASWLSPRAAPAYSMTGVECPSLSQVDSGSILLVQWRFAWFPIDRACKRARLSGNRERFVIPDRTLSERTPAAEDSNWDTTSMVRARCNDGLYCSASTDGGETWDWTDRIPIAPFARGYGPRPTCQLADGTLLLALASHDDRGLVYIVRSTDNGTTSQSPPTNVSDEPPLAEPTICALPGCRLLILSRDDASGFLWQHTSDDGGVTWSVPRRMPIWGCPAHLLGLSDGRLLAIYGVRRPAFGIRACLSEDEGNSWDHANELRIHDDLPNPDLGYPTAVELRDGRVFTAYYGQDTTGVTHIMGSTFGLT
jgi:sialidase-1